MPYIDPTNRFSSDDESDLSVSHSEFYDEHLMTQEIEALTIISGTQEITAIELDDDTTRA